MSRSKLGGVAILFSAALVLAGCAQSVEVSSGPDQTVSGEPTTGFTTFPDMPMPSGAQVEVDKSLIFGAGEGWFGRLVITTSNATGDVFNFYKENLAGFGWREITSVRAKTSVLTYMRDARVATIQIESRAIRGALVTITVSPRGTEGGAGTAPQAGPAGSAAPVAPVQQIK